MTVSVCLDELKSNLNRESAAKFPVFLKHLLRKYYQIASEAIRKYQYDSTQVICHSEWNLLNIKYSACNEKRLRPLDAFSMISLIANFLRQFPQMLQQRLISFKQRNNPALFLLDVLIERLEFAVDAVVNNPELRG